MVLAVVWTLVTRKSHSGIPPGAKYEPTARGVLSIRVMSLSIACLVTPASMGNDESDVKRNRDRVLANWLGGCSLLCAWIGFALPNFQKAGGMDITLLGLGLGIAGVMISIVGFCWCPRRCLLAKLLTFFCLLPVLNCAVEIGFVIVGRWFDPSFGHC